MVMQAISERAAPGKQVEAVPAQRVEHPNDAVLKIWGFLISETFARVWTIAQTILPYAALATNGALVWKYMPELTETQLYGLGVFAGFSLLLCLIARK